ncbi:MAG TPA: hypothetical protein VLH13_00700 [Methanomassiliicoccales archaeon]|nr:hypothetical protein [Methanomassiliicoccales archaeon]
MVLSSANSGKYVMEKWHEMRRRALIDRTQFSQDELDWLEIADDQGLGDLGKEMFKSQTTPIDPLTEPKDRDIRDDYDKA